MSALAAEVADPGFADHVSAQRPYLVRVARQRLRDPALVEDMVQDTLLAALSGAARFKGQASLRTWLTGILLRRIADGVRREHRHGAGSSRGSAPAAVDATDAPDAQDAALPWATPGPQAEAANESWDMPALQHEPVEWRDPQRMLEGRQFVQQLGACLEELPREAARAFTLREIDGLSTAEVAEALQMDAARCALLLHRTRLRLRERLSRH